MPERQGSSHSQVLSVVAGDDNILDNNSHNDDSVDNNAWINSNTHESLN